MADRVGQQLGNYRLVRLLGQGGFAEVYLGEHLYLKTQAALKVLQVRLSDNALEVFLNEAQTIARLEHPHIGRVLEFGVEDHIPFLVMTYAPNGTLRQRYPRGSRLSSEEVLLYLQQIASALQYVHDKRLIHRDVKPENLLLGPNDNVLLSDFGLVLLAQSTGSQATREMAGTIPYMAPEQLQGKPRPASDQYALGIVVYEWLCGERPFQGTFVEIASQHLLSPPPPLYGKVPGISPAIESVVFTALAKDPQQRFATMQAFTTAFEQARQIAPHHSQPLPPNRSQPLPVMNTPSYPSTQSTYVKPLESDSQQATVMNTPSNQSPSGPSLQPLESQTRSPASHSEVPSPSPIPAPKALVAVPTPGTKAVHAPSRRGFSRGRGWILIALVITLLLGSVGWFAFPGLRQIFTVSSPPTSTALSRPSPMSPMFGFDPQHTHFNPDEHILSPTNASRLVQYWTASTGGYISSSPAVVNGIVYVGSHDGKLYAFNASTGAPLWSTPTNGAIVSSPAVVNGVVYIGSFSLNPIQGGIYAFNASTGASLWSTPTNGILSSPAVVNGVVYVGSVDSTSNGKLYAFNASTGTLLWSTPTNSGIDSSPAVANGVVYVGSVGSSNRVSTLNGTLYAFNASTGALRWSMPTNGIIYSSPAIVNGVVYIGSFSPNPIQGGIYAFNASTGAPLWSASSPNGGIISSPAVVNGVVYIGSVDLDAFNASTGAPLWSTPTGGYIDSSPAVANGVVYIGSFRDANTPIKPGNIYAFNASTGAPLWSAPLGTASFQTGKDNTFLAFSSPAVINGVVYIGSDDGKLYAFHLPDTTP